MTTRQPVTTVDGTGHQRLLVVVLITAMMAALLPAQVVADDAAGTPTAPEATPVRTFGNLSSNRPDNLTAFDGRVVFREGTSRRLWISDGTEVGTSLLGDEADWSALDTTVDWVELDGHLYFSARGDGTSGFDIWRTDGTRGGTERVTDRTVLGTGIVRAMAVFGSRIAVQLFTGDGDRLYLLDDNAPGGATMVVDEAAWTGGTAPRLGALDDRLLFTTTGGDERRMYRVDQNRSVVLIDSWPASTAVTAADAYTRSGDALFFRIRVDNQLRVGITDGVELEYLTEPGTFSSIPTDLTVADGRLFFQANNRLWVSDGTADGTTQLWVDAIPDTDEPHLGTGAPADLVAAGDRLAFASGTNADPPGWWSTDGTPEGTEPLRLGDALIPRNKLGFNQPPVSTPAAAWLGGSAPLLRTDGTSAGTIAAVPEELRSSDHATIDDTLVMAGRLTPTGSNTTLYAVIADSAPSWGAGASLRATSVGSTFVELAWDPAIHGQGVTAYRIDVDGVPVARVDAGTTSLLLDGLDQPEVDVEVVAFAGFGAASAPLSLTVPLQDDEDTAPGSTPLEAVIGPGVVTLTWTTAAGAERYVIERADADGDFAPVGDPVTTTTSIDEGPPADTTVRYRVLADLDGELRPHTAEAEVTTPAIALATPVVTPERFARDSAGSVVALGAELSIVVTGDPHRNGEVTLTTVGDDDAEREVVLPLERTGPGTYGATTTVDPGTTTLIAAQAELCDDRGTCSSAERPLGLGVGAEVEVTLDVPDGSVTDGRVSLLRDGPGGGVGTLDGDGRAVVRDLLPGDDYRLVVTDPRGRTIGEIEPVELRAGLRLELEPEVALRVDRTVAIEYVDGAAVRYASLRFLAEVDGAVVAQGRADDRGRFDLRGIPAGDYLVEIEDSRATQELAEREVVLPLQLAATDEQTTVTLTVPDLPTAMLTGRVVDGDGQPLAGVSVAISTGPDASQQHLFRVSTGSDGSFTTSVLIGEGTWTATLQSERATGGVTVVDGANELEIVFDAIEAYDVRVDVYTKYAGAPREGPVALTDVLGVWLGVRVDGSLDRSGRLHRLRDDRTQVRACADGRRIGLSATCSVADREPDGLTVIELEVEQPAAIVGELLTGDGTAFGGTFRPQLVRVTPDGVREPVESPTNASFEGSSLSVTAPGAGTYELSVTAPRARLQSAPVTVTVDDDEVADVGGITLLPQGPFADTSAVTPTRDAVAVGETLTLRADVRHTLDTAVAAVRLELELPAGVTLVDDGLRLDGVAITPDGTAPSGTVGVDLGDIAAAGSRAVRATVRVDEAAADRAELGVRARVAYDDVGTGERTRERVPVASAQIIALTIEAPRTTADLQLPVAGRARPGARLEVLDGTEPIARTRATPGGYWDLTAELVDRGPYVNHRLRVVDLDTDEHSRQVTVRVDPGSVQATEISLDQGHGVRQVWDPADGVARFPFTLGGGPLRVQATFDTPDRIVDPQLQIGSVRVPMVRVGDVFEGQVVDYWQQVGPIWIDIAPAPAPIDVDHLYAQLQLPGMVGNRLPGALDDLVADEVVPLDEPSPTSTQGHDAQVTLVDFQDPDDGEEPAPILDQPRDGGVVVQQSTDRWGLTIDTTLIVEEIDYEPTAADLAYEARTGLPVYARSFWWTSTDTTFRFQGTGSIPLDVLPAADDLATGVAAYLDAHPEVLLATATTPTTQPRWDDGSAVVVPTRIRRVVKFGYEVTSAGSTLNDTLSALSGADIYDELGDLLDEINDRCNQFMSEAYRARVDRIARDAAAAQLAGAGLMVGAAAAAAATGGLGGIAVLAGAALLDLAMSQGLQDRIDNVRNLMDENEFCDDVDEPDAGQSNRRNRRQVGEGPLADPRWIYDPAGYVFEAVESNRLAGATVTVFEGDPADAAAPDGVTDWRAWNADWFGQTNPLVTGVDGRYAWDVPEGWWFTRAELDGYHATASEVLRVLPEHFDVHLGLISLAAPTVTGVEARTAGDADPATVTVTFDHWMRAEDTVERIHVLDADGDPVPGVLEPVDAEPHSLGRTDGARAAEVAPAGELLAERFVFVPSSDLESGEELTVRVDGLAQAYNLKYLGDDHVVTTEVESRGPSIAITSASWVEDDPVGLRGLALAGTVIDGATDELDQLRATLTNDGGAPLAVVQWTELPLGQDVAFVVPFDIAGWGDFDYVADGRWAPDVELTPLSATLVARAEVEAHFTDGTVRVATVDGLTGELGALVPTRVVDDPPTDPPSDPGDDGPGSGVGPLPPAPDDDPVGSDDPDDSEDREVPRDPFTDVRWDSTHGAAIAALAEAGVLEGRIDGSFGPTLPLTRGQSASVIARALELDTTGIPGEAFADTAGTTHRDAINALAAAGVALGQPDGTFQPDVAVTRGQLAALLVRAFELPTATTSTSFSDVDGTTHAAAITTLEAAGIARGFDDGTFGPNRQITRAQAATLLFGLMEEQEMP